MPRAVGEFNVPAPLTPTIWSQDTLEAPDGYGVMPEIDALNAINVKREYYSYTGNFNAGVAVAPGLPYIETVNITRDADFWISSFVVGTQSGDSLSQTYCGELTMVDNTNGYSFFTPSISVLAFQLQVQPGASTPTTSINDWLEPYCIRRGGTLTLTLAAAITARKVNFSLNGWKEYRHVSR